MSVIKSYLVAYNVLSVLSWSYLLFLLGKALDPSTLNLDNFWERGSSVFFQLHQEPLIIQSTAILEVVHAALGLVKSSPVTTLAQVFSRLFIVWFICPFFPSIPASTPFYASMLFAWCLAEIPRYAFYATSLLGIKVNALDWIRYNVFWALYPLGAGSEWVLISYSPDLVNEKFGEFASWVVTAFVYIWPIALGVMITHMNTQRTKFYRKKSKLEPITSATVGSSPATPSKRLKKRATK